MSTRKFPEQYTRVETGPIQFGEDWPGLFIRGDTAAYFAFILEEILLTQGVSELKAAQLRTMIQLLRQPIV